MDDDSAMSRAERVAIMVVCGNIPEVEAQRYCDSKPELYGIRDFEEKQESLL